MTHIEISHQAWRVSQWRNSVLQAEQKCAFESFEAARLEQAFIQLKVRRFQAYTVCVAADFCVRRTVMIEAQWQGREETVAFWKEVQAEIAHEFEQPDDYFMDAKALECGPEGLEVQVFILPKIKIAGYLNVCQQRHLRLHKIEIAGEIGQGLNVYPWRQQRVQRQRWAVYLRVLALPMLVLLGACGYLYVENNLLSHQQKIAAHLHKQEVQYLADNPDAFTVQDALIAIQPLAAVNSLKIDAEGQLDLSGFAAQPAAVSAQLQEVGDQAGLVKNSLHDLQVHEDKGRTLWQASFQLARSQS